MKGSLARNVAVGAHVAPNGVLLYCLHLLRHLELVEHVGIELILRLVVQADDA